MCNGKFRSALTRLSRGINQNLDGRSLVPGQSVWPSEDQALLHIIVLVVCMDSVDQKRVVIVPDLSDGCSPGSSLFVIRSGPQNKAGGVPRRLPTGSSPYVQCTWWEWCA